MMRWRRFLLAAAALAVLSSEGGIGAHRQERPESDTTRLTADEIEYLWARHGRNANGALDSQVAEALGLIERGEQPPTLPLVGLSNPSHGDTYFMSRLPAGRMLLGRQEWTGRITYWLVVSADFQLEGAILQVAEGTAPLRPAVADTELRRIVNFLKSSVPILRSDAPRR